MKLLLILALAFVGVVAQAQSNPLLGSWHLLNKGGEGVDVVIDKNTITNADNPLDTNHYVLIQDVLFFGGKKWLVHVEDVNHIIVIGWSQDRDGDYFIQILTLTRMGEEILDS